MGTMDRKINCGETRIVTIDRILLDPPVNPSLCRLRPQTKGFIWLDPKERSKDNAEDRREVGYEDSSEITRDLDI